MSSAASRMARSAEWWAGLEDAEVDEGTDDMMDSFLKGHKRQEPGGCRAPGAMRKEKARVDGTAARSCLRRPVTEGMATGTTVVVVQDVPVDGFTQTQTGSTARGTANDAVDDHAGGCTQQHPERAAQKADLRPGHGCGHTAGRSGDGSEGATEPPGQVACPDVRRLALGTAR